MAVVPVIKADSEEGRRILATPSLEVGKAEFGTSALVELIENLKDTKEATSGVGIAAPQIGVNKNVVVVGFEKNERYPNEKPVPLIVLINPVVNSIGDTLVEGWEGCLSVPGSRGLVPRYENVRVRGYDVSGKAVSFEASGFHARIWQHECDHLSGKLFTARATRIIAEEEYLLMLKCNMAKPDTGDSNP